MAMQRRISISFADVFPHGAYLVGEVEPELDFTAGGADKPQKVDPDTGLRVWKVPVLDADPEAKGKAKAVTVKVLAEVQPVPPANSTASPFTPVSFDGMSATPYIDDSGNRPRIAWSLRATGFASSRTSSKAA